MRTSTKTDTVTPASWAARTRPGWRAQPDAFHDRIGSGPVPQSALLLHRRSDSLRTMKVHRLGTGGDQDGDHVVAVTAVIVRGEDGIAGNERVSPRAPAVANGVTRDSAVDLEHRPHDVGRGRHRDVAAQHRERAMGQVDEVHQAEH